MNALQIDVLWVLMHSESCGRVKRARLQRNGLVFKLLSKYYGTTECQNRVQEIVTKQTATVTPVRMTASSINSIG